jgi:hypothetical protein
VPGRRRSPSSAFKSGQHQQRGNDRDEDDHRAEAVQHGQASRNGINDARSDQNGFAGRELALNDFLSDLNDQRTHEIRIVEMSTAKDQLAIVGVDADDRAKSQDSSLMTGPAESSCRITS